MDVDKQFESWSCACKAWDAAECTKLRYRSPNGLGDVEDLYLPSERCECACHSEDPDDEWDEDDDWR